MSRSKAKMDATLISRDTSSLILERELSRQGEDCYWRKTFYNNPLIDSARSLQNILHPESGLISTRIEGWHPRDEVNRSNFSALGFSTHCFALPRQPTQQSPTEELTYTNSFEMIPYEKQTLMDPRTQKISQSSRTQHSARSKDGVVVVDESSDLFEAETRQLAAIDTQAPCQRPFSPDTNSGFNFRQAGIIALPEPESPQYIRKYDFPTAEQASLGHAAVSGLSFEPQLNVFGALSRECDVSMMQAPGSTSAYPDVSDASLCRYDSSAMQIHASHFDGMSLPAHNMVANESGLSDVYESSSSLFSDVASLRSNTCDWTSICQCGPMSPDLPFEAQHQQFCPYPPTCNPTSQAACVGDQDYELKTTTRVHSTPEVAFKPEKYSTFHHNVDPQYHPVGPPAQRGSDRNAVYS